MSLPIKPTPILDAESTKIFWDKVEAGLKNPIKKVGRNINPEVTVKIMMDARKFETVIYRWYRDMWE